MAKKPYFQVVKKEKTWEGEPLTCKHKHKTYEAAQKCKGKLLNYNLFGNICSSEWYSANIKQFNPDGTPFQVPKDWGKGRDEIEAENNK